MLDWQTISALAIVAVAVAYFLGKFLKPRGTASACGNCSRCPSGPQSQKTYQLK